MPLTRVLSWLLLLPAAAPAFWFVQLLLVTPPLIVLYALSPVILATLVVLILARHRHEPPALLLAAFLWGAIVAAYSALVLNGWLESALADLITSARARVVTPAVGAPIIEEVAKATVLGVLAYLGRRPLDSTMSGIVYGALVGLGFELTENINYLTVDAVFKGPDLLPRSAYLRGLLGGFDHALFSATVGAGLGYARERRLARPIVAPAVALFAAIGQHILWNVIAAHQINALLCNPDPATGSCQPAPAPLDLFVTVPLVALLSLGPGVVLLTTVARVRAPAARSR